MKAYMHVHRHAGAWSLPHQSVSYLIFSSVLADSSHQRAGANLRYFERLLAKQLEELSSDGSQLPASEEPIQLGTYARPKDHLPEREVYEALCRGEGVKMVRKEHMLIMKHGKW